MNRLTGKYVVIFFVVFGFLAYLTEKMFGISGYITCSIAALAAIALAVSLAEKKTKAKFGEE